MWLAFEELSFCVSRTSPRVRARPSSANSDKLLLTRQRDRPLRRPLYLDRVEPPERQRKHKRKRTNARETRSDAARRDEMRERDETRERIVSTAISRRREKSNYILRGPRDFWLAAASHREDIAKTPSVILKKPAAASLPLDNNAGDKKSSSRSPFSATSKISRKERADFQQLIKRTR